MSHTSTPSDRRPAQPRPSRGFTLVELLVVIGIIALLISILLPSLSAARERGNAVKCLSNLRQIGMAFTMYANENKGFYPYGARYPNDLMFGEDWIWYQEKAYPPVGLVPGRPDPDVNQSAIARYIGNFNAEFFRCPSDNVEGRGMNGSNTEPYKYSYSMNGYFEGRSRVVMTRIRNPSDKILVAEEDENSINDGLWSPGSGDLTKTEGRDLLGIRHERKKVTPDPRDQNMFTHPNGQRRGNVVFVDGHGEYISRVEAHDAKRIRPEK